MDGKTRERRALSDLSRTPVYGDMENLSRILANAEGQGIRTGLQMARHQFTQRLVDELKRERKWPSRSAFRRWVERTLPRFLDGYLAKEFTRWEARRACAASFKAGFKTAINCMRDWRIKNGLDAGEPEIVGP